MEILCPCCSTAMNESEVSNVYICPKCEHIFRNYSKEIDYEHYYSEDYRKKSISKSHPIQWRKHFASNICKFIQNYINPSDTNRVLEIGAGTGVLSEQLKEIFKNVSVNEANKYFCQNELKNFKSIYQGNFLTVDIKDDFDFIVSIDVIEHIKAKDLLPTFEKIHRTLSLNGYVLIQVPTQRKIHDPNQVWDGHYHFFTENSFRELTKDLFTVRAFQITEGMQTARGKEILILFQKK